MDFLGFDFGLLFVFGEFVGDVWEWDLGEMWG